jgi:2-polyprenyl-3-methyl-5-hydroxy-6-metoxy-1,4-benzoquinol methylase
MPLSKLLRRRRASLPDTVDPALLAEVSSTTPWMYAWRLSAAVEVPGASSERDAVHTTRLDMITPVLQRALANAGPDARVLDLGCNEGWFAHQALALGARSAVGVDVREVNIRRADLLRRHFGIEADRLSFHQAGVHDLDPSRLGTFDVVLMLGLLYHLEDPIGALRVARGVCSGTILVESQLTAHNQSIRMGWGQTDVFHDVETHWAAFLEPATEQADDGNTLASFGGVVSLVPNRAALLQAVEVAGFRDVRMLDASPGANRQYVDGHRGIAVGVVYG